MSAYDPQDPFRALGFFLAATTILILGVGVLWFLAAIYAAILSSGGY